MEFLLALSAPFVVGMVAAILLPDCLDYHTRTRMSEELVIGKSAGDAVAGYYEIQQGLQMLLGQHRYGQIFQRPAVMKERSEKWTSYRC